MDSQIIITLRQEDSEDRYHLLLGNPNIEVAEGEYYIDCEYWIEDINPFVFDDWGHLSKEVGIMAETSMKELGRRINIYFTNGYEVESISHNYGKPNNNDEYKKDAYGFLNHIWSEWNDGAYDETPTANPLPDDEKLMEN